MYNSVGGGVLRNRGGGREKRKNEFGNGGIPGFSKQGKGISGYSELGGGGGGGGGRRGVELHD